MTSSFLSWFRLRERSEAGGLNWMRISTFRSFKALPAFKMKGTPSHLPSHTRGFGVHYEHSNFGMEWYLHRKSQAAMFKFSGKVMAML